MSEMALSKRTLNALKRDLTRLSGKKEKLSKQLHEVERQVVLIQKLIGSEAEPGPDDGTLSATTSPTGRIGWTALIRSMLQKNSRGLTVAEMAKLIENRALKPRGTTPVRVMVSILARRLRATGELTRDNAGKYSLKRPDK